MSDVQVRFKGYVPERLPSGAVRHRVRVEGQPKRRIVIPVGPGDPTFTEHYWAARAGHTIEVVDKKSAAPVTSLDAMIDDYLFALEQKVEGGNASPHTLRQRRSLMLRAREVITPEGDRIGSLHCDLPREAMVHIDTSSADALSLFATCGFQSIGTTGDGSAEILALSLRER